GFALYARSFPSALVLYSLVALSQGGTYTTAIMLMADRYPRERRGAAVGWLLASSSLGYAVSLLVSGAAVRAGGYRLAFAAAAAGPVVALVLAWMALRGTPNVVHPRAEGPGFGGGGVRHRPAMRLLLRYPFHSGGVLCLWAWARA